MAEAKPFAIPKQLVWEAYQQVKANRGAAGVDGESLEAFDAKAEDNLYKLWNRMSSGSYFPPPVRLVEIPKKNGGKRPLGIPTVTDRIAQTVVKRVLEPQVEPVFHPDSYAYRPNRSALDAVGVARKRCWKLDWVIDMDVRAFFDSLDHDLVMRAVRHHTSEPWVVLYIERWLKAPAEAADGKRIERTAGTPQGGVVSPLLANLFMHYAFDHWMRREHPGVPFERYADDVLVHCMTKEQAQGVLDAIRSRLKACGLELHSEKTRLVYCKDDDRPEEHRNIAFDFLGFTFRPRLAKNRWGKFFVSFLPAISSKAAKAIREKIRSWKIPGTRNNQSLEDIARLVDPAIRGWMNYYGQFYPSWTKRALRYFNVVLNAWVRRKYKDRYRNRQRAADHWLGEIAKREPNLFALWQLGVRPAAGQ